MTSRLLLGALREFPARLAAHLETVPAAGLDYAPESWEHCPSEALTIRQHACHLRDIEIDGYQARFSRTLREEAPRLASIDGLALVRQRDYDATPVDAALAAFTEARGNTVSLLETVSSADLRRTATFEGYGDMTLHGLIHLLVSHDQQHLAGVAWLLGKFESRGPEL